jgi:low affinity Fe/Cu permease
MRSEDWFRRLAQTTAERVGRPQVFLLAVGVVVVWAVTGPIFRFSDTWQLVINTGTTIVTFLMVFLIQNTQNRDAHAVQLKLDELIVANKNARNALLGAEGMSDEELARLEGEFAQLQTEVATHREKRKKHVKAMASAPPEAPAAAPHDGPPSAVPLDPPLATPPDVPRS